jgi:hypothetical protein
MTSRRRPGAAFLRTGVSSVDGSTANNNGVPGQARNTALCAKCMHTRGIPLAAARDLDLQRSHGAQALYFGDYRFSEDLDLTLAAPSALQEALDRSPRPTNGDAPTIRRRLPSRTKEPARGGLGRAVTRYGLTGLGAAGLSTCCMYSSMTLRTLASFKTREISIRRFCAYACSVLAGLMGRNLE